MLKRAEAAQRQKTVPQRLLSSKDYIEIFKLERLHTVQKHC